MNRASLFLLLSCSLLLLLLAHQADADTVRDFDLLSSESLSDEKLSPEVRKLKDAFKEKTQEFHDVAAEVLGQIKDKFRKEFSLLKSELVAGGIKVTTNSIDEGNMKTMHYIWSGFKHSFYTLLPILDDVMSDASDRASQLRVWVKEEAAAIAHATHADELKEKSLQLIGKMENRVKKPVSDLLERLRSFIQQMEISGGLENHKPHQPMMACNSCGKVYKLQEFMDIFDHDHNLLIKEEKFWTDEEVEEFYEGWSVWANHLKLRCIECGESNWDEVRFVEEPPRHSLHMEL